MKLAVDEPESEALRRFLANAERVFCSEVSEIEVARAAVRAGGETGLFAARRVLAEVSVVELDREARRRAVVLGPPSMKPLDAIHLATALGLAIEGIVFVGYDQRLQEAAAAAGLEIASPGA